MMANIGQITATYTRPRRKQTW